ncbi:Basic blue protein [Thalictrum thalictroides]|uniref:Plantacyanin n=1 Tax=Thalictrum thalictroides TaxID=46969 RepID=A0A7J6VP98_THATH|nr:Basic blue protein [Thalictrum thalictroides]
MVQGRGSAKQIVTIIAVTLLVLLLHSEIVDAATFQVGDAGGWTFNSASWTKGKKFKAGDVLVFKYNPSVHNVVQVDQKSYNSCMTPSGAKVFKSGNDQIKLAKGQNSFICSFISHCQSGMKITVNAA